MSQRPSPEAVKHLQDGVAAVAHGRGDDALEAFRRAVELAPELADAWVALAGLQAQRQEYDGARDSLRQALGIAPEHATGLLMLGTLHLRAQEYDEAARALRRGMELLPEGDDVTAHLMCAKSHLEMDHPEEARDLMLQAIARDPLCAEAHLLLGQAEIDLDEPKRAISPLTEAVRLAPDSAEAHYCLGVAVEAVGQWAKAATEYERVVALDPEYAGGHAGLAHMLAELGKSKYAVPAAERALQLEPDDPFILASVARTHQRLGRLGEAARLFQRAAQHDPSDPGIYMQLFEVAVKMGDDALATQAFKGLQRADPEAAEELHAALTAASAMLKASKQLAKPTRRGPAAGRDQVYQLKISLRGIRPPIWRRVLVTGDTTLSTLHRIIQLTMEWEGHHLHEFTVAGARYSDKACRLDGAADESRVSLGDLGLQEKSRLTYCYDFGDDWGHTIVVEKILPVEKGRAYPACTGGKRSAPPEDCGGVWGYYRILDALQHPDDPKYAEVLEWVGAEYDPAAFHPDWADAALQSLQPRKSRRA